MRQFVSSVPPNSNGLLEISGKDFHYLKNVLRLSVGDMAPVSIPGGQLLQTTVCKIDSASRKIVLQVCDSGKKSLFESPALEAEIFSLLQFIPKPQKMELIVRQAAECGIKNIVPVMGEYSQGGNEKALQKLERFERVIKEARQQSGSQVETKIFQPQKLEAALDLAGGDDFLGGQNFPAAKLVFYERTEKTVPLHSALFGPDCLKPRSVTFAVGSEGGVSPSEFDLLLSRGFKAVHFDTNILRCETAALYAAAAIQSALALFDNFNRR